MNRVIILLCVVSAAVFSVSTPVSAQETEALIRPGQQESAARVQELLRIIEVQQRQLDAQQNQLQELRQQVQALADTPEAPEAPVAKKPAVSAPGAASPRRTDTQTRRRDKDHPHDDWKGSFGVNGFNTRFMIGGFAELDAMHDTGAIASKGSFITSTIVTGEATKTEGSDGQTSFSVNPTRLYLETRTPINQHRLTTYVSMDFFGDGLGVTPDPRMRQAYGEITGILFGGDLLAGQAWSTFADVEAFPDTLNFQGPNSFFGTRQPLVRWTKGLTSDFKLALAAETPDNHIIQGADSLTAWPDGVLSMVWKRASVYLMGSFVARDLRASFNNGPTETAFGWGGSFSGKLGIPFLGSKDFVTFSATYGEGIGSGFNDAPPDAVFNSTGSDLEAIPAFGYFASLEHWWSRRFSSVFVYGALQADNLSAQPSDSFKQTQYASGNLVWRFTDQWLMGVEGQWGAREDKDGADGSVFRAQFTTRFSF